MRAAITLGLAVVLAGCLGGSDRDGDDNDPVDVPPGGTPPPPDPDGNWTQQPFVIDLLLDFEFTGCHGITVMQDQTTAEVQALLPEGFVPSPNPMTGLAGSAVVAIDVFLCDALTTPYTQVNDTTYGQLYTFIERPTGVFPAAPDAPAQEYVFGLLGGEDQLPVAWTAAGYRTHSGPVTYTPVDTGPAGILMGTFTVGDYTASAVTHPVTGTVLPIPIEADFARYTMLDDGSILLWTGHYAIPEGFAGAGTFSVPADDPFAQFEDGGGLLRGASLTYPEGAMTGMDLSRYLPPFQ